MNRVLIVDDEEIVRCVIRRIGNWDRHNMTVVGEAVDGIEALQKINEIKPNIVFLDMRMPGLSGVEVIQELEKRGIKVKLVVVSGFDSYEYTRMALRYGAVDYLLKPIRRDEFEALLERLEYTLEYEASNEEYAGDTLALIYQRIENNCCCPITLETLAREFFLNKDYLSRAFKKRYGIGVTALIHKTRIEIAKRLLESNVRIRDVAERTGYSDVNYFGRMFKRHEGVSPREYVEANMHQQH